MFGVKVLRFVIIEVHPDDDPEKCGDDRHVVMLANGATDSLTDLSLSRGRPSRATIADPRKLAKHELQPPPSTRPRVGCSEELGGGTTPARHRKMLPAEQQA